MSVDLKIITLPLNKLNSGLLSNQKYLSDLFEIESKINDFILENSHHQDKKVIIKEEFLDLFKSSILYIDDFWGFEWELEKKYKIIESVNLFHNYISNIYTEHNAFHVITKNYFKILSLPIEKYGLKLDLKDHDIKMDFIDAEQIQNSDPSIFKEDIFFELKDKEDIDSIEYAIDQLIPFLIYTKEKNHDLFYFYE